MNEKMIRDKLVEHGQAIFNAGRQQVEFTRDPVADGLLNDLENHPHAFVLACMMHRRIKAERAWFIPYRILQKIGTFSFPSLAELSRDDVKRLMTDPEPLHCFGDMMSTIFHAGIGLIRDNYGGDASLIWAGQPSSAEVVYRFLEFKGAGPKIASMAANILARDFKIPMADYYSIDVSADVHVRRVFCRLGLCKPDATTEHVIYKARALHPEFPGIMDLPCWELGRNYCKAKTPDCPACYMQDICLTAGNQP